MSIPPTQDSGQAPIVFCCPPSAPCRYVLLDCTGQPIGPINLFLQSCCVRALSPATVRTYAFALRDAWRWLQSHPQKLQTLTEAHLLEYLDWLSHHESRVLAPRSINLRLLLLRMLYRFHTGHDLPHSPRSVSLRATPSERRVRAQLDYPRSPQPLLRPVRVKVPNLLPAALGVDQIATFLASLRTFRDRSLVALALLCGLRSCELLSLRLADVDWDQKLIRVRGKGSKDRLVPMADPVVSLLIRYGSLERPSTPDDRLFVVLKGPRRGAPMTAAGLRSLFRYHRRRAGVPEAHPHRLRHTFARELVRAGVPLPALMRLMGHSHIEMTLRYVNLSVQDLAEVVAEAYRRRPPTLPLHE